MTDASTVYRDAVTAYRVIKKDFEKLAKAVRNVAFALEEGRWTQIKEHAASDADIKPGDQSLHLNILPTAQEIGEGFSRWHAAKRAMEAAHAAMTPDERSVNLPLTY